jgi:hypothetical protein
MRQKLNWIQNNEMFSNIGGYEGIVQIQWDRFWNQCVFWCHTDLDFTLSIVQVNIDNIDYCADDKIICYFCLPRIGMAIALRHGDYLLVNAREPHCLSPRCHEDDQLYSISCYLKTSVVGLNNNSIPCDYNVLS